MSSIEDFKIVRDKTTNYLYYNETPIVEYKKESNKVKDIKILTERHKKNMVSMVEKNHTIYKAKGGSDKKPTSLYTMAKHIIFCLESFNSFIISLEKELDVLAKSHNTRFYYNCTVLVYSNSNSPLLKFTPKKIMFFESHLTVSSGNYSVEEMAYFAVDKLPTVPTALASINGISNWNIDSKTFYSLFDLSDFYAYKENKDNIGRLQHENMG